jgi:hypothetical protein
LNAETNGNPGRSRLGRLGSCPRRAAAHSSATVPPARHARDVAGLAPPPGRTFTDLPHPARAPLGAAGRSGTWCTASAREPGLGVPQGARGTHQRRLPLAPSRGGGPSARPGFHRTVASYC